MGLKGAGRGSKSTVKIQLNGKSLDPLILDPYMVLTYKGIVNMAAIAAIHIAYMY